jgi:UDPglucose--hexose-1-phosphate uridylyltransferase
MLSESIAKLVQYGVETELIPECERNYTTNLLLDEFQNIELEKVLDELLKEAIDRGLIEDSVVYKDLFDTRLMNCLMPRPAEVQTTFWKKYGENPKAACRRFYFKP